MKLLNKQEVFTKVKNHLLKQKQKATTPDRAGCWYRTPDGRTCAIGCMISKKEYTPKFDERGLNVNALMNTFTDHVFKFSKVEPEFLRRLQRIHDTFNVENWPRELKILADECGLKY